MFGFNASTNSIMPMHYKCWKFSFWVSNATSIICESEKKCSSLNSKSTWWIIFSFNLTAKTAACNSNLGMVKDFTFDVARRDFAKRKFILCFWFCYCSPSRTSYAYENVISSILQSSPSIKPIQCGIPIF